jgi:hypothetical protein
MLTLLASLRDFLIAAALSWVGITLESTRVNPDTCAAEACEPAQER